MALDLFRQEWTYVCRRAAGTQFSGGRAKLAEIFRGGGSANVSAYGSNIQSRSWWKNQLPGVSVWRTAAWALPIENSGRGAFKHFEGDKISLPMMSSHLPSADLVRALRPDLSAALEKPEDNVLPSDERGPFPHVVHVANKKEALRYFKRKQAAGMLSVHKLSSIPKGPDGKPISAALIAVSKGAGADKDRGVSDRRLANWREKDLPCPKLAHGSLLTRLSSDSDKGERWWLSMSDLPDCFHNLSAKGSHEVFNAEGVPYAAKTLRAASIQVPEDFSDNEMCMCCSSTVMMGDKKSVAIAQTSHLQMLRDGECEAPFLEHGCPVPSDQTVSGVIVDDFAVFSQLPGNSREELHRGFRGYNKNGIGPKDEKTLEEVSQGIAWGTLFDGEGNRVSPSIDKIIELVLISLAAIQYGSLSPLGMQILAGGWGFCLMFRRSMFCLLHQVYEFARWPDCDVFRNLDPGSQSELFLTALTSPFMCSHLDWPYGNKLFSHDACGSGGCAFGSAEVTPEFLRELWRFTGAKEVSSATEAELAGHSWRDEHPPAMNVPVISPGRFKVKYIRSVLTPFRTFTSKHINTLNRLIASGLGLFLELWSGSAGLTRAMTQYGCETLGGVDICQPNREDLVDLSFVELLLRVVSRGLFKLIHMGIVCTTFSIAAKPAYRFRDQHGVTQPVPGLPDFKKVKVALGDWFVHLGLAVFELQMACGLAASIENPGTSMLWHVESVQKFIVANSLSFVALDMCQFGAAFKKFTKILTNVSAFSKLNKRCTGNHIHEVLAGSMFDPHTNKWQSRTKLAAEYPVAFCQEYAQVASNSLEFVPKGTLSASDQDAFRVTDMCFLCDSSFGAGDQSFVNEGVSVQAEGVVFDDGDALGGSPEESSRPSLLEPMGTGSKRHVCPWEEVLEELSVGLNWRTGRAWSDKSESHINILEVKAWAGLMRKLASSTSNFCSRVISLWDSKVGRAATAKGRSSAFKMLSQYRAVLPSLLGAGLEYGGFWIPSESMPMDGPSRGRRPPSPLPGDFYLPSRSNPIIDLDTLMKWRSGKWTPLELTVAQRREARYGLRGVKVGEARVPGPKVLTPFALLFCGMHVAVESRASEVFLRVSSVRYVSVVFSVSVLPLVPAPRPRRVRRDDRPLGDTVVDQAFQRRLDSARRMLQQFLCAGNNVPSWEALSTCDVRAANQALMHWVQYAFEHDLTYNQAVEGVLAFSHEHFWVSLKPTWRLLRSWRDREPVEVRHPIHLPLLKSCVVIALCWGWEHFAMLLWLGYHALLRPGELAVLTAFDFVFHQRLVGGSWQTVCIVRILRPKTRRLGPRRQHTLVTEQVLVSWIHAIVTPLKLARCKTTLTSYSLATLNRRFTQCLFALGIPPHTFTLASLRAGGATWEYLNDAAIANLKFRGRWAAESSLEHYVQECVAFLDFEDLTLETRHKIDALATVFVALVPTYIKCKMQVAHPTPPPVVHTYHPDSDTGMGRF